MLIAFQIAAPFLVNQTGSLLFILTLSNSGKFVYWYHHYIVSCGGHCENLKCRLCSRSHKYCIIPWQKKIRMYSMCVENMIYSKETVVDTSNPSLDSFHFSLKKIIFVILQSILKLLILLKEEKEFFQKFSWLINCSGT